MLCEHPESKREEVNMENPRPEKVAVVAEVAREARRRRGRARSPSTAACSVGQLAALRRRCARPAREYKVYKNTLVRRAAEEAGVDGLTDSSSARPPSTFVSGDVAAAAKALRDYAKTNPLLVVKGGALGGKILSDKDVEALADLPSRDVLLAQLAGAFQAPLVKMAGLLQALPRNFAYGLKALIDQQAKRPDRTARHAGRAGAHPPHRHHFCKGVHHHGSHQGRDPRRHLQHDRARAVGAALARSRRSSA